MDDEDFEQNFSKYVALLLAVLSAFTNALKAYTGVGHFMSTLAPTCSSVCSDLKKCGKEIFMHALTHILFHALFSGGGMMFVCLIKVFDALGLMGVETGNNNLGGMAGTNALVTVMDVITSFPLASLTLVSTRAYANILTHSHLWHR